MYNFFIDQDKRNGDCVILDGSNYNHLKNVLRMNVGDTFLVSSDGRSDLCELKTIDGGMATAQVIIENYQNTELPIKIYLFQGLPKSDKMEFIIQKAVELGAHTIVPVEMNRCVVKLDDKKKKSKQPRWQSIAESAAKQSKRNVIPQICEVLSYTAALKMASELDLLLVPYENKNGMVDTVAALNKLSDCKSVGIIIGPEGGFDQKEVESAMAVGGLPISLGSRILRTETAAITALSMCMLHIEMNLGEAK